MQTKMTFDEYREYNAIQESRVPRSEGVYGVTCGLYHSEGLSEDDYKWKKVTLIDGKLFMQNPRGYIVPLEGNERLFEWTGEVK